MLKVIFRSRTNERSDGLGILFDKQSFDVIESDYLEFFIHFEHTLLCKDNIALFAVLQPKVQSNE